MHASLLRFGINLWPPFLGAGIHVETLAADYKSAVVSLRMGLFNRNNVGVHFGGSLFAMTDPFFMLMMQHNLGKAYVVWDSAAKIDFIKPGRGKVRAHLTITDEQINEIKAAAASDNKVLRDFSAEVKDQHGDVVATVVKTLYVRKRRPQ